MKIQVYLLKLERKLTAVRETEVNKYFQTMLESVKKNEIKIEKTANWRILFSRQSNCHFIDVFRF